MTSSPGARAEVLQLRVVSATFAEEHEGVEVDTQGNGRLGAEDVVRAVTDGISKSLRG
jgi:hypothetical protein